MNAFVIIPMGICIFLFFVSAIHYIPNIKHLLAVFIAISSIYFMLWDDYQDEWKYVKTATKGRRTTGHVISCEESPICEAVHAYLSFIADNKASINGYMFLWHGIAPNFFHEPGDEVEVAYDPDCPRICMIITEETNVFNLRKDTPDVE